MKRASAATRADESEQSLYWLHKWNIDQLFLTKRTFAPGCPVKRPSHFALAAVQMVDGSMTCSYRFYFGIIEGLVE